VEIRELEKQYLLDKKSAIDVINQINSNGGESIEIQADISIEKDIIKLFKKIDTINGTLVGLVNNAGVLKEQSSLAEMST